MQTPGLLPGRFSFVGEASAPSVGLTAQKSGDFQLVFLAPARGGPGDIQGQAAGSRAPSILGYLLWQATIRRGAGVGLT